MPLHSLITQHFTYFPTWSPSPLRYLSRQEIHFSKPCRKNVGSWPGSHVCTSCLTSSCDSNRLARRRFFSCLGKRWKSEGARYGLLGSCSRISQPEWLIAPLLASANAVQCPLRNCVVHENCGAWATQVLPPSDQCLNFKWIERHLTMWSYLVAIK